MPSKLDIPALPLERADIPAWASAYGPEVLEHHAKILHESAVSPEVALARGWTKPLRGSLVT
jgi:hypothetical protein